MRASDDTRLCVEETLARARDAMAAIAGYDQGEIDRLVKAVGWAIYEERRARHLAEIAVEDTGLGNVQDKITKNQRKTLGTLADLMAAKTVGIIEEDPIAGLVKYGKPVGVVGTLTPSTNPAATPANQAMMAIKGGNAIVVSPSPTGLRTARQLETYIQDELEKVGAPQALFQVLPGKVSFEKASVLMELADLLLVTGDQINVRRGYRSGTPCIGVGKGNVPVIVHHTADLKDAAEKIAKSKTFDNATSCSSENAVIVEAEVYDAFKDELQKAGGYLADETECARIESAIFSNGAINREVIGKTLPKLAALAGLDLPPTTRFIAVEQEAVGSDHPLSGEKLCLVLSLYRADNFDHAIRISNDILDYEGIGHSVGIHCSIPTYARRLARSSKVARVLMNQAHTFGNGGGFNNSLPFTLSMGCGTWAGNSISENMSYKNFINITTLAMPIAERRVRAEDLFAEVADLSEQKACA